MPGERSATTVITDFDWTDADQNIDALMTGYRWNTTTSNEITFSFTDSASDYNYNPGAGVGFSGALNTTQQIATRMAFAQVGAVADLEFTELAFGSEHGTIRLAEATGVPTAFGYYPNSGESGGDIAFNPTDYNNPTVGSFAFATFMHEIGHALGLRHGHETGGVGSMTPDRDSTEFSVMTYNSFVGQNQSPAFTTNATNHNPQTLMMYDIAALQRLYGANWDTNSGNTTYTFSTTTGETLIDGVAYQTPAANVIFLTMWDSGGTDTYDLSNYTTNLAIDLTPGGFSDFDVGGNAQRARINAGWDSNGVFVGESAEVYARGHLFNALQYNGDARSLIENAIGGTGNDLITGNAANNELRGGRGNDTIIGGAGNDRLFSGHGSDDLRGGAGDDYIRVGGGLETFYGGEGHDYISYYSSSNGVTLDLAANTASRSWASNDEIDSFESASGSRTGHDRIYGTSDGNTIRTYGGDDRVYARGGSDTVYLGSGDDYVRVGGGVESFYGGSGHDYLSYYSSSNGVTVDLASNTVSRSWAVNDTISSFESVSGSRTGHDRLYGTGGENTLRSYGGNDKLYGRSGDDRLYGGSGNDRFDGGAGTDLLYGGTGADIFHFDRGEDHDIIKDFENNVDVIQLDNFTFAPGEDAFDFADQVGADVVFTFGNGDILTVENATIAQLYNDVVMV